MSVASAAASSAFKNNSLPEGFRERKRPVPLRLGVTTGKTSGADTVRFKGRVKGDAPNGMEHKEASPDRGLPRHIVNE